MNFGSYRNAIESTLYKNVVISYFDLVVNSESDLINILN
jgi:hypothetical protein